MNVINNPEVRHTAYILFDVVNGNPNGDPDAGNRPRTDDETGHGLVTDVALKRKIRDIAPTVAATKQLDANRYEIFVNSNQALNTSIEEAYKKNGLKCGLKDKSKEDDDTARDYLSKRYYDIRMFGGVLSTGVAAKRTLGGVRGPLFIGFGNSVDPISPSQHTITRVVKTTAEALAEGKRSEMGDKWTVPYGLYIATIEYSAAVGAKTGISSDDLDVFWSSLQYMFEHDRSAARGIMATRAVHIFSHDNALGSAPEYTLAERVDVRKAEGVDVPRGFKDYAVTVNTDDLPSGITHTKLI